MQTEGRADEGQDLLKLEAKLQQYNTRGVDWDEGKTVFNVKDKQPDGSPNRASKHQSKAAFPDGISPKVPSC